MGEGAVEEVGRAAGAGAGTGTGRVQSAGGTTGLSEVGQGGLEQGWEVQGAAVRAGQGQELVQPTVAAIRRLTTRCMMRGGLRRRRRR